MSVINAPALFFETFKGAKSGSGDSSLASGAIAGAATGALVSGGSAALMSNSGSKNVEKCPISDDSLYCQVSRTAGITGMVVYMLFILIFVIAFFYFLYYIFFRSGGKSVSKTIRKGRR
jgi:hypothetical protein